MIDAPYSRSKLTDNTVDFMIHAVALNSPISVLDLRSMVAEVLKLQRYSVSVAFYFAVKQGRIIVDPKTEMVSLPDDDE